MKASVVRRHAANAMSVGRLLLTPLFLASVWRAERGFAGWPAAVLFALIAATDFADGRVARTLGTTSQGGRTLDHLADIVFLVSALSLYWRLGHAPWWVPASIGTSFAVYVADSWLRSSQETVVLSLRGSRIGHAGGVLNYAVVGCLVFDRTAALHLLGPAALHGIFLAVPLYSGAAIVQRLDRRRKYD